ncbi:helix-turn-helix domain-containing protein [Streptomyces sioyaensis]|uniref:helix-turn-helix domain-containing protein n=1 Tax=Streptomyces sioyaensis TaxID=67364 RepID=UPI00379ED75F
MTQDQRRALLGDEASADDQRDLVAEAVLKALNEGELREAIVEAAIQALNRGYATLTTKEAAKALGCGERFLRDGCNKHGFPYIDLGKEKRFGPAELQAIQNMCRVPARPSLLAKARRANKARPS